MAKKQFVWIMTDTTGFNLVSSYGSPIKTPCIDSMGEEGIRFERVYTCQPVCGPARSALFTGLFPHSNGNWGSCMALGDDMLTLGQRLSKQGVACGYIGKWHLDAGDYFGNGICPDGWEKDYWYDMKCYLEELTDEERAFSRKPSASDHNIDESFTYGYRVTQKALRFMQEHKDEDFFLVVSYDEPHGPSLCPEPYASMYPTVVNMDSPSYEDTLEGKPLLQTAWAIEAKGEKVEKRKRGVSHRLAGCTTFIDSQIGKVLAYARASLPDSLRMFTSDHGDAAHAHGLRSKGPCVYDEVARVPLFFEGNAVNGKAVYPHVVSHIDLPATVLDYMGHHKPPMFQGESLLPVLKCPTTPINRPAFVEFGRYEIDHDGYGGFQPMRAIITDAYKLCINLMDSDELYDTKKDPYNLVNCIEDDAYSKIRNALHDQLLTWMNETRDPFRGYQWQARTWRKDKTISWDVDGYTRQKVADIGEACQLDYDTGLPFLHHTRVK